MTVRRPHGFTLIEVMVALAITAIALMAGLQATGALTRNATRQSDVLLAQLCLAMNDLDPTAHGIYPFRLMPRRQ